MSVDRNTVTHCDIIEGPDKESIVGTRGKRYAFVGQIENFDQFCR